MGGLSPEVYYRPTRQVNPMVRWPKNGQIWMFRYLDSNQDNSIQSAASCQLLNTGREATGVNSERDPLLRSEYRSRRSGAKHWARHGGGGPALDLAVEVAAPTDVDPQAAEVTVTDVLRLVFGL